MLRLKLATRGLAMEWAPSGTLMNIAIPTSRAAKGMYRWLIRDGPDREGGEESLEG